MSNNRIITLTAHHEDKTKEYTKKFNGLIEAANYIASLNEKERKEYEYKMM